MSCIIRNVVKERITKERVVKIFKLNGGYLVKEGELVKLAEAC